MNIIDDIITLLYEYLDLYTFIQFIKTYKQLPICSKIKHKKIINMIHEKS